MHIRKKKWARPELEACPFYTDGGEDFKNGWKARFARPEQPLHLEMGCGKGISTAKMIADNPDINYIAVDISEDVLGDARRNIVREAGGRNPENVYLLRKDIAMIETSLGPEDRAERIYISFCNPWTARVGQAKRRLTHPRQLTQYRTFLADGGEIWFKTDDEELYEDSLGYFLVCGFEPVRLTRDLHNSSFQPNWESEHEIKFAGMGIPIKAAVFRKLSEDPGFDPTRYRLTPRAKEEALRQLADGPWNE